VGDQSGDEVLSGRVARKLCVNMISNRTLPLQNSILDKRSPFKIFNKFIKYFISINAKLPEGRKIIFEKKYTFYMNMFILKFI
jgi:hypothetical protein